MQADSKSGTAHTVNFAKAYGRKLIGIRWPGSKGVVDDLERDGYPVIDIFDDAGVQRLDAIFRELIESGRVNDLRTCGVTIHLCVGRAL